MNRNKKLTFSVLITFCIFIFGTPGIAKAADNFTVEYTDSRVTINAQNADLKAILTELAHQADFPIRFVSEVEKRVSLTISTSTIEEVVSMLTPDNLIIYENQNNKEIIKKLFVVISEEPTSDTDNTTSEFLPTGDPAPVVQTEPDINTPAVRNSVVKNTVEAPLVTDRYKLQAGDKLYIQVFDEPDLTTEATVTQSGEVNYSYLGKIKVAGKTTVQLADDIAYILQGGYLKSPSVKITLQQQNAYSINGEVNQPGDYEYESDLTLEKAVSIAGGLTSRASKNKIYLTREIDGNRSQARVRMSEIIQPGDTIRIEEGFF